MAYGGKGQWVSVDSVEAPERTWINGDPTGASTLVSENFDLAQTYAVESFNDLSELLPQLQSALTGFVMPETDINYDFVDAPITDGLALLAGYRPERPDDFTVADVERPAMPALVDIASPDIPDVPAFNIEPLDIFYPEAPSTLMPMDPGDAPGLATPERVTPPSYVEPTMPAITDVVMPDKPGSLSTPSFEGVRPVWNLTPPETTFVYNENPYSSTLLEAIKAKILGDIQAGSTGLSETVREAVYQRARDKVRDEYEANYRKIQAQNQGFRLPPGAMVARLDELTAAYIRQLAQLNYEITVKDAELALANSHFMIEKGLALEQILIGAANDLATRAFEAAKTAVTVAVELYNAQVAGFNARLQAYQADAQVYEIKFKAAALVLEQYKTEMEAARLGVEIQNQKVVLYNAQWEAVKAAVSVYSEQVKAQSVEMEVERLKIEAFKAQVDVFAKKVEARTAMWNLYQAQLSGEGLKVEIYGKQVDAYRGRVDAARSVAEMEKVKAEIGVESNKNRVEIYRANIDMFRAEVDRATEQVKALVQAYGVDVDAYKSDVSAINGQQQAEIELLKAKVAQSGQQAELALKEADLIKSSAVEQFRINIEAIRALIATASQLAASALGAVHVSAQVGNSFSLSDSQTRSQSSSVQQSASLSETYSKQQNVGSSG